MGKVIAVAQHKGGAGKTVTCVNLGASLAEFNKTVLLVDMDPQAALTLSLGINPTNLERSIYDVLVNPDLPLKEIVLNSEIPRLFVVPSHINLAVADLEFGGRIGRERLLKKKLDPLKGNYDYVLLDCGPTLGLLTINALAAADSVIIPIQCELLSLYGLKHLLDTIELVRDELNEGLEIEGFLLTMYDARTRLTKEVAENVQKTFGDQVFKTIIRRRVKIAEAPAMGSPITSYAARSEGAEDYRNLAKELLGRSSPRQRNREV
ncbi:MAG TPA: ParA family protein [Anaerolineae bacterium]|nr:ParA family protein [Anaerolineae bacterium]